MSTFDLEEQEQLAALRAWWKEHGGAIFLGVILAAAVFGGWTGWTWYQRSHSAQAAELYESLQKAARANDLKTVRDAAGAILENYSRSAYAPLAALVSAKVQFQAGDLKTARAQLQWAIDHASSDGIRSVASLRLSSVLFDDGEPEAGLKALEMKPSPGFEALFASQRGDILLAQKKLPEARDAYKAALEKTEAGPLRDTLRTKLEALGNG
ncbi:MAG: tetratricopeptide repeat protein [Burkholderiales bacterium]